MTASISATSETLVVSIEDKASYRWADCWLQGVKGVRFCSEALLYSLIGKCNHWILRVPTCHTSIV